MRHTNTLALFASLVALQSLGCAAGDNAPTPITVDDLIPFGMNGRTDLDPSPASPPSPEREAAALTAASWGLRYESVITPTRLIFLVSELNSAGELRAYGTVHFASATSYEYLDTPTDRIVVILADGGRAEYRLADARGDFSTTPENFVAQPHVLTFTTSASDGFASTVNDEDDGTWTVTDLEYEFGGPVGGGFVLREETLDDTDVSDPTAAWSNRTTTTWGTATLGDVTVDIGHTYYHSTVYLNGSLTSTSRHSFGDQWQTRNGRYALVGHMSKDEAGQVRADGNLNDGVRVLAPFQLMQTLNGAGLGVTYRGEDLVIW